ncbi:phospholipase A2 inhibitor gamma subunit B-like [Lampris incognitus]|uniref:phospholipase A2 inhibitor gamma subunit B-like n=1 Tax=Lampris incognitus TaxID=2546036 RepID=UPI0024B54BCD|nr:phospholipase A2 inhibitor gamma subunit B-like [Lampris incognitus]
MQLTGLFLLLTWTVLQTAEALQCHRCTTPACTNTTSVECDTDSPVCTSFTSVTCSGLASLVTVTKSCVKLSSCTTPLNQQTEVSVNLGFAQNTRSQLCCNTDNCNFQTLASPLCQQNGKRCPSCGSLANADAGSCNSTMSCAGSENSCFSGTISSSSKVRQGCISKNLCTMPATTEFLLDSSEVTITCRAPWSLKVNAGLLLLGLSARRFLF